MTSTGCYIPAETGKYSGKAILVDTTNAGRMSDDVLSKQVATFRSCMKAIAWITGCKCFPSDRQIGHCLSLTAFPGGRQASGIQGRPILVHTVRTIASVENFFVKGAYVANTARWTSSFPFDRDDPIVTFSTADIDPHPRLRINRFCALGKRKQ